MKGKNNFLGLYVSYYLARFNENAYAKLGYGNQRDTHKEIGRILDVKPATIKNWRDEFDPLFGNRAGWYQRTMSKSRLAVANALADLDEFSIFELVKDILLNCNHMANPEMAQLENIVSTNEIAMRENAVYVPRSITGTDAEKYFLTQFHAGNTKFEGKIEDCRNLGCGYDFKVTFNTTTKYLEVKGRSGVVGGLHFTNKEWDVAKHKGDDFYLCLVSEVAGTPTLQILQNPASFFEAEKYVYSTIQVSWTVSQKKIFEAFR